MKFFGLLRIGTNDIQLFPGPMESLTGQITWLLLLGLPAACVSWTITHEELFREFKEECTTRSATGRTWLDRKCYYVFTCEYCLSHYVALILVAVSGFRLLLADWRGFLLAVFALVWVVNHYMSIFARLRLDIRHERVELKEIERQVEQSDIKKAA